MSTRYFGVAVPRLEDPDLLTGRGRYVDDIILPGMLHAAFLRSPVAHGR
jgi:carbon-monoxide dehydrogenase large subunit